MSKRKYQDDEPEEMEKTPVLPSSEIAPGCSEPNTVPPSVGGTTHDPKKQKED